MEIQKFIKELEFLQSDLKLKLETINEIDSEFKKDIDLFVESHPKLKYLLQEKKQYESKNSSADIENDLNNHEDDDTEIIHESKDPKLKSLYRQIARTTHPDVNNQKNLQEIYIEARKAYDDDNLFSLVSFCEKLQIPYDLDIDETLRLEKEIEDTKKRIKFLESTLTWQWYNKKEKRTEIILSYIKTQLVK
jgi:hypothetical protein